MKKAATLRSKWLSAALAVAACFVAAPAFLRAATAPGQPSIRPADTNALAVPRTHRLQEDELRALLTNLLNQKSGGGGAEWELRLTRPWTPVTVPDEPLSVELLEPSLNRITSTCILRFELRAGHDLLGSWQAPVQAHLWREVLVAHSNLRRGQSLSDAEFLHERRDVLALRDPIGELPADLGAYELAESIPANATLTARALRLKPLVFRGQMADAVVRDGAMMISLKVEVLEEGLSGQVVRVRNPQSRRELRGKVQDEKTIAIIL